MTYCTGRMPCIPHYEPRGCPMLGKCDRYIGNHPPAGDVWQTSPAGLVSATACRSVAECVRANTPTLAEVIAGGGREQMAAFIEANIVGLAGFCNLGASITPAQIQMTTEMILGEFGNLTIADVNLIFRRAKMGEWGVFFGRLDGQMILSWCAQYLNERCDYCAVQSENDANAVRAGYSAALGDKFLGKVAAELAENKNVKKL